MASAARVFTIPEILEMILLRLPERDLLLSQRVNTTWRNITKTSPHLQRKLFYKADVCDPALISDVVWNPLLRSILTKNARTSVLKAREIDSTYESVKVSSWNDMFLTQPAVSKIYVKFHLNHHGNDEQPVGPELALSQGPVKGTVENPDGVTMEDIRSTEWIDGELAKVEGNRTCFHFRLALYKNFAHYKTSLSPSAMLPSTETFGIPELLEMILENAEPRDLLLWQRVNKTWQAAIQRSPRIQEKLYFRAKPCKDEDDEQRAVLNPFMDLFLDQGRFTTSYWIAKHAFDGKASCPTASWQRMSITSPAITELVLFKTTSYQGQLDFNYEWSIACESGITIGQLADNQKKGNTAPLEVSHDHDDGDEAIWISGLGTSSFTGRYRR